MTWTKEKRTNVLDQLGIVQHANGNFSKDGNRLAISFTPDGRVLARGVASLQFKEIYRIPLEILEDD